MRPPLIDSNVVIEAARPESVELRQWIAEQRPAVSAASLVEVLRYPKLSRKERADLEALFATLEVLEVSQKVVARAEDLRRRKRMSTGDALIAATALLHRHELVTRNVKDFAGIPGLAVRPPPEENAR